MRDEPCGSHLAIELVGWSDERTGESGCSPVEEVHRRLKSGEKAYLLDERGNRIEVIPRMAPGGEVFVQALREGRPSNGLMSLPVCPVAGVKDPSGRHLHMNHR